MWSDLLEDEVEVEFVHNLVTLVKLEGNEFVDERARHAALNGAVFEELLPPEDFQGLVRSVLLREWQEKWDAADTGKFAHSILLKDSWTLVWGSKGGQEICFHCVENNVWTLYRPITLVLIEDCWGSDMFEGIWNSGPLDMALRKIRDR
jgi:hypothetical protein